MVKEINKNLYQNENKSQKLNLIILKNVIEIYFITKYNS